jgi:hypothetical protein
MNMNNQWFALQRQCIHTTILPKDTQREQASPFREPASGYDQVEIKGRPKCPTTYTCTYIHMALSRRKGH